MTGALLKEAVEDSLSQQQVSDTLTERHRNSCRFQFRIGYRMRCIHWCPEGGRGGPSVGGSAPVKATSWSQLRGSAWPMRYS